MNVLQQFAVILAILAVTATYKHAESSYASRKSNNPYRKSTVLSSIAHSVNSNPDALWHAPPSLAGRQPRNTKLLRPRRSAQSSSFDWKSTSVLRTPEHQGRYCQSCWAFASIHAFDDLRSTQANRRVTKTSMKHMTSCCEFSGCIGCKGASKLDVGFMYLNKKGIVTESCLPYDIGRFAHGPQCRDDCVDEKVNSTLHYLVSYEEVEATEEKIREALKIGPLIASMEVYEDFVTYKGGIYKHNEGEMVGLHAVELVGYGSENGLNYWIGKNSWGTRWGEDGYFRIRAGVKESGMEGKVAS